jgi:hypothetical protein
MCLERWEPGYGVALVGLLISQLACRPALTVGWMEILVIFGLGILAGAPLWLRLYRRMIEDRQIEHEEQEGEGT